MLIIQIALGIVLGFLIISNLEKILSFSLSLIILGAVIAVAVLGYIYLSQHYTLDSRRLIETLVALAWLIGIGIALAVSSHYFSIWLGATQQIAAGFIMFTPMLAVIVYSAIESLATQANYVLIVLSVILLPVYSYEIRRMRLDKLEEDKRKAARSIGESA